MIKVENLISDLHLSVIYIFNLRSDGGVPEDNKCTCKKYSVIVNIRMHQCLLYSHVCVLCAWQNIFVYLSGLHNYLLAGGLIKARFLCYILWQSTLLWCYLMAKYFFLEACKVVNTGRGSIIGKYWSSIEVSVNILQVGVSIFLGEGAVLVSAEYTLGLFLASLTDQLNPNLLYIIF